MPLDLARIQAICFDVDGTLSDTDDRWVERLAAVLRPLRLPQHRRLARWLIMGMETPANWLYEALDRLHLDDEAARLVDWLFRQQNKRSGHFTLIEGVDEMLMRLKERYPLAVVSARGEKATLSFLEQFNLRGHFRAIATALTCVHTKPLPHPVLWAAEQMGVNPVNCLMVGDTVVDIRAGKAAGAQTVGVLCGFGRERELRRAGADLILENTAQLSAVLRRVHP